MPKGDLTATDTIAQLNGVIALDKPVGISSARAVAQVKTLLPRDTKIGHAGTLDPFATGLLLLLVGRATKSCEALMDQTKVYDATIKLGATTETDDPESPEHITAVEDFEINADQIRAALQKFVGLIEQTPPVYSALKINGRRACDRVREGQAVSLPPRKVRIDSIELLGFSLPFAEIRVTCGRGTYIRAIARDLGNALRVGGYLTALRRRRIGNFDISGAVTIDRLRENGVAPFLRTVG